MASPFPGMDPYLEGKMWQEFHKTLTGEIRAQLLPQLKPKYVALLAKRYTIDRTALGIVEPEEKTRIVYPDVHVAQSPGSTPILTPAIAPIAVVEPTVEVPSPMLEEVPLLSVEIRDVAQRRLELFQTRTHLLELALLCQGERIELLGELPPAPYYVYLSRSERRPYPQVWALSLRKPLPAVPVPLLRPDPDVVLDLQAALTGCFDLVGYEDLLNYADAPPAGLDETDREWVISTLNAAGRR